MAVADRTGTSHSWFHSPPLVLAPLETGSHLTTYTTTGIRQMEDRRSPGSAPPVGHVAPLPPATLTDGVSGVWAWHSAREQPVASRYALADGCSYLLFGFGAERAGQRDLVHARLIGPRTRPFLIDEGPRLRVGLRFTPGLAQAAFGVPASELLDQRVDDNLVCSDADQRKGPTAQWYSVGTTNAWKRRRVSGSI
jgi:hypothetical protein